MSIAETQNQREEGKNQTITIAVNNKPVVMETKVATGLQIKDAAIAQGVKIQRNFILTEELPGDKSEVILDDQEVKLQKRSEFTAVTPDDNS